MATEDEASSSGNESFDYAGNFDLVDSSHWSANSSGTTLFRDLVGESDEDSDFEGFEPEDANAAPEFGTWRWERKWKQSEYFSVYRETRANESD